MDQAELHSHVRFVAKRLLDGRVVPFLGAGVNLIGRSDNGAFEPGAEEQLGFVSQVGGIEAPRDLQARLLHQLAPDDCVQSPESINQQDRQTIAACTEPHDAENGRRLRAPRLLHRPV